METILGTIASPATRPTYRIQGKWPRVVENSRCRSQCRIIRHERHHRRDAPLARSAGHSGTH
eukprot:5300709-Pleurochrysis_carterae.AAC.1